MSNSGGAIIDLGAVNSNPTADSSGQTEADILGNVSLNGGAGADSVVLSANGNDESTAGMSESGGGLLHIGSSDATSKGSPQTIATLGGSASTIIAFSFADNGRALSA